MLFSQHPPFGLISFFSPLPTRVDAASDCPIVLHMIIIVELTWRFHLFLFSHGLAHFFWIDMNCSNCVFSCLFDRCKNATSSACFLSSSCLLSASLFSIASDLDFHSATCSSSFELSFFNFFFRKRKRRTAVIVSDRPEQVAYTCVALAMPFFFFLHLQGPAPVSLAF